jgi:hypothetical protein
MKFQVIIEGQIHAVEPIIKGEPLGIDQGSSGTDTLPFLNACVKVLEMAAKYAEDSSEKNLDKLGSAACSMLKKERNYVYDEV